MTVPVFTHPEFDGHEEVAFGHDPESGLKAIIAIHNSARGPALGGCRMWPYESEEEALTDVLRLSRGMTYKAALAGLDLGGGKSVIIADPHRDTNWPVLFYFYPDDVGALHRQVLDAGETPTEMTVTHYVMREFSLVDPDGHVLSFGEDAGPETRLA